MPRKAASPPPPTRRVDRGNGHSYFLDGVPALGVTTILKGIPKPALMYWAANQAAEHVVDNWEELSEMGVGAKYTRISKAPWAKRDKAAVRGTVVHGYAEKMVRGDKVKVPEHLELWAQSAARFMDDFDVEPSIVEKPFFNRRYKYAGTPDAGGRVKGGGTALWDYKTSASGIWPETAIQLVANAKCEFYIEDGEEIPVPQFDELWGVQLREDGYARKVVSETYSRDLYFRVFRAAMLTNWFCALQKEDVFLNEGEEW